MSPNWSAQYTYDKLSRPVSRTDLAPAGTTNWTWGISGTANDIGRLASITSPGSYSEIYSYDSLTRLTQRKVTADGASYFVNLTYVPATGLLDTLEYPTSTAGYRLKLRYEYASGLLKRVKDANGTTVFWEGVTDAWGHIQDETFGNGVVTITDFDQASGLMLSREGGIGGGAGLIHAVVDWDLHGNLKERLDLRLSPAVTEDFHYDSLNRFDYSQRNGTTNDDVTLDAIGNISWKLGVGNYAYHATKKRAVITAGGNSFGYDANGNMTSRNGASISYTSYNLPSVINAPGGFSSTLSYGAFRNRFKQVAVGASGTETTIYVAGLLEKVTRSGVTEYRHTINGGVGPVAIYSRISGGANSTYYLHRDHLGSPEVITSSSGLEVVRPSFGAYGERRDGTDWNGPPSTADLTAIAKTTRRGFTWHEHLDSVGLIHMNGRVYEPVAGRFLGADPIRMIGASQDANPFAYALNDPLNITDPSGLWRGIKTKCKDGICTSTPVTFPSPTTWFNTPEHRSEQRGPGGNDRHHNGSKPETTFIDSLDGILVGGPGGMYGVEVETDVQLVNSIGNLEIISIGADTGYTSRPWSSFVDWWQSEHDVPMCGRVCWAVGGPITHTTLTNGDEVMAVVGAAGAIGSLARLGEGLNATSNLFRLPERPGQYWHIFRNKPGHLLDTPANRQLLIDVANNPANRVGVDEFGNVWSTAIRSDGTQVWVSTRNGIIENGGVNQTPEIIRNIVGP